jgi:hypothetical protein
LVGLAGEGIDDWKIGRLEDWEDWLGEVVIKQAYTEMMLQL